MHALHTVVRLKQMADAVGDLMGQFTTNDALPMLRLSAVRADGSKVVFVCGVEHQSSEVE